ncbi:OmpA/MotB family protein [Hyalangium rubrum]|uniref:OmpA family protein n=1 Tax=Hyalangium rubrum TaxID=3103134 RepID=A0ABU5H9A9_9BACT|nr:OmpA family protein [Hyalangium sp. s54d21]MDY7230063.1 OmpA family protein [Hyalangium sp. s54d21]
MADSFWEQQQQPRERASRMPWVVAVLVVLLLGVFVYFGLGAYRAAQARIATAESEALKAHERAKAAELAHKALEEKLAALDAERTRLSTERDQLSTERDQLSTERDQLSQAVQEKEAELARLKATYTDLEEKMKAEIAEGEIRLSQAEGRIQVDLVDKILFDSGEAKLTDRGAEVLSRLGTVLVGVEGRSIQVSGHTDDSPPSSRLAATFPTNWELSVARAVNVVRFLQEKAKVPARRLVAAGYGDTHPVASNATPKSRARNRRIEILLIPDLPAAASKAAELTNTAPTEEKKSETASAPKPGGP